MTPVGIKTSGSSRLSRRPHHWRHLERIGRGRAASGPAAKGYLAVSVFPSGTDFKVSQTLKKDVIDAGKGDPARPVEVRLGLLQRRPRNRDHLHRGAAGRPQEVRQPSPDLGGGSVGARASRHHAAAHRGTRRDRSALRAAAPLSKARSAIAERRPFGSTLPIWSTAASFRCWRRHCFPHPTVEENPSLRRACPQTQ